ncbi:MAG: DNA-binding NtrC family response regulator [Candidatus Azotimanducaceae bacterium]|jgi:DNA-binding NtrC family response regulator
MSDLQNKKILIIEDEALVARELKSRLTQMGCDVVGIAYGSEGIELARRTKPDLLLTDIHLKDGEDGIEMARTIQAERDVPVVFLTAYSDEATVSRAKEVAPYGYIIKPVDNRELQIAIDMALYKFDIERELKETQQLLQTALTCIGSALVFVNENGAVTDLNADAEDMLGKSRRLVRGEPWPDLFTLIGSSIENKINAALGSSEVVKLAPFINHAEGAVPCLLDGIVGPMEHGGVLILRALSEISDPIEAMPTTGELMSRVGSERLIPSESSMCQLLIARQPSANREMVEEISAVLNQQLRSTDLVSAYAASYLSVSMPYTSVNEGRLIANSLLGKLKSHFPPEQGDFCIGLSFSSPGDQQPFELFRRASWGLKVAQDAGGDRVIVWNDEIDMPDATNHDQKQREYQNLVLLWNILNVVANTGDLVEANRKLCSHLQRSFGMTVTGILQLKGDSVIAIAGASELANHAEIAVGDFGLSQLDFDLIKRLMSSQIQSQTVGNKYFCKLNSELLVALVGRKPMESADIEFLKTLLTYYAAGLNRFNLPEQLPDVMDRGELVFASPRMKSLIETVQLVAETDATVLIEGESGTGKEMLARKIHEESDRKGKPFIIVDCGAVVSSLIESELFGHRKGAFTGADKDFIGRLREADGGTVLLDEIGELPLEVQVKLLRYVQDKEIVSVGGSQYQTINTRIIAATNKDLKAQVESGQFREDLFYRLNVFTVDAPPLRERGDDVILLAQHYLVVYATQYKKSITGFTAEAQRALVQYGWPGNIRELTNVVNRAVILCKDSTLSTIHLGLFPKTENARVEVASRLPNIESFTAQLVNRSLEEPDLQPIAQWMEEDLIYFALHRNAEVLNRAAADLGIPESTLRRKVQRLRDSYGSSAPQRPDYWRRLFMDLSVLFEEGNASGGYLDHCTRLLMADLDARDLGRKQAATLMGVSLPTYRRMSAGSP